MKKSYDMCTDVNTLYDLHTGLKKIKLGIENSVSQMDRAIKKIFDDGELSKDSVYF